MATTRPTKRPAGIRCPQCGEKTRVIKTATQDTRGRRVGRRRACVNACCGHRFNTTETPAAEPFSPAPRQETGY